MAGRGVETPAEKLVLAETKIHSSSLSVPTSYWHSGLAASFLSSQYSSLNAFVCIDAGAEMRPAVCSNQIQLGCEFLEVQI